MLLGAVLQHISLGLSLPSCVVIKSESFTCVANEFRVKFELSIGFP